MPGAYVFALANHVLCLHRLREAKRPQPTDVPDLLAEMDHIAENDPADQVEAQRRVEEFERALTQLSPRAQQTLVQHRRDGLSIEDIAIQFGVSRPMAKKCASGSGLRSSSS